MLTVCETHQFVKKAGKILRGSEKDDLIDFLSLNPKVGAIIEGQAELEN